MKIRLENLITLGKYAFKLGLAATLAFVIAQLLHLEYPIYALIAPIIIMGNTRGSTFTAGINRIKGTVIGTVAGGMFASLVGSNPFSILIVSTLVIFLCRYWELEEAYRLAGYVSAIVVMSHSQEPWLYALGRFLETMLGISVALAVNTYLWPSPATENLRRILTQMLADLEKFYQIVFNSYITGNYQEEAINQLNVNIIQSIRKSESLWQEAKKEQSGEPWIDENWEFLVRRIWQHIATMNNATLDRREDTFWQGLAPQLTELAQFTSISFSKLADAVNSKNHSLVLPNLEQALMVATAQLENCQKTGVHTYSVGEILRFASLFYSMEEIARKLKKLASFFDTQ